MFYRFTIFSVRLNVWQACNLGPICCKNTKLWLASSEKQAVFVGVSWLSFVEFVSAGDTPVRSAIAVTPWSCTRQHCRAEYFPDSLLPLNFRSRNCHSKKMGYPVHRHTSYMRARWVGLKHQKSNMQTTTTNQARYFTIYIVQIQLSSSVHSLTVLDLCRIHKVTCISSGLFYIFITYKRPLIPISSSQVLYYRQVLLASNLHGSVNRNRTTNERRKAVTQLKAQPFISCSRWSSWKVLHRYSIAR